MPREWYNDRCDRVRYDMCDRVRYDREWYDRVRYDRLKGVIRSCGMMIGLRFESPQWWWFQWL